MASVKIPAENVVRTETIDMPAEGEARVELPPNPAGADEDYLRDLAFYEEPVKILVHPTMSDRDTSRLISLGVNGVPQYILAGTPITVKRKYVEVLAKARPDTISTEASINSMTGKESNSIKKMSYNHYNFDILEDKNPRGREWIADLRKQFAGNG